MTLIHYYSNSPNKWHEVIIELFIKEVKDSVSLLDHIQEVEVGSFGICRRNSYGGETESCLVTLPMLNTLVMPYMITFIPDNPISKA